MPRSHLTSLRISSALIDACLKEPYNLNRFLKDVLAGVTVGIISIPLAMALAMASGVPPQYGLYTATLGGFIVALTGGSRFSISGPTAAFVVILYPVSKQFGLGGLLTATFLAGILLIGMAVARLGRLIEYIPGSVTLGFTSGIAVVIATLQVKDFLGLSLASQPESYVERVWSLVMAMPTIHWPTVLVASLTLLVLLIWRKLNISFPGHLPAILVGTASAMVLSYYGFEVDTIGTRFTYELPNGLIGQGIPSQFPSFTWPWKMPGSSGEPIVWSWQTIQALLPAAFSIAMLGAIESLLCAVVLDNMTGRRHHANGELLGLGLGNMVVPFFGGIAATAAIARSVANFKAKAESPVSAMIHALFVLIGLLCLAPVLAYLPIASMAALLVVVAWNIAELHKVIDLAKKAPLGDILVLGLCFSLTVLFDMVIAISVGMVLASFLFMREIARMTRVSDITMNPKYLQQSISPYWAVYRINGPLFFAAADRIFAELSQICMEKKGIILYFGEVSLIDAGGLSALQRFIDQCRRHQTKVVITDLQFQPLRTLAKAHIEAVPGELMFAQTLSELLNQNDESITSKASAA
ncbi:MAG: C4-dicarboxylic acid transporter DauA [Gammaproteobacteria bacterium]